MFVTHHISEASRMLVLLARGATGASAMIMLDSTAPPKQYSMELNQHANGLLRDTSNAPATKQTARSELKSPYGIPTVPLSVLFGPIQWLHNAIILSTVGLVSLIDSFHPEAAKILQWLAI